MHATDQVVRAGLLAQLGASELVLVLGEDEGAPDVTLVATDTVTTQTIAAVRLATEAGSRAVVVARELDGACLANLVESGCLGVLRRAEVSPERLASAVIGAAHGEAQVPSDLLGRLLSEVRTLQHGRDGAKRRPTPLGITAREAEVLRLVADGYDTSEVAAKLYYSERTVKNVIHDVVSRHQLANRTHAVAYAIRRGWI